jgi:hypothetical protein
MRIGKRTLVVLVLIITVLTAVRVEAGGLGRAVARGAAGSTAKALRKDFARLLRRDFLRDRKIPARPLPRPKTVYRYTSKAQAQLELRKGLQPNTHMTAEGRPGRPLSPKTAESRYGLPQQPEVRETIRLPQGFPVRPAKAFQGSPGVGEITSPESLPPTAIKKVVPLRGGKR